MAVGIRKTTFSDIAKQAGISRVTLYRRYPDLATLLQALVAREFGAILESVLEKIEKLPTKREQVVEGTVMGIERFSADPFFLRLLELDPEMMLPYLMQRLGQTQKFIVANTTRLIVEGQKEGSVRSGSPKEMAAMVEAAGRALVFAAGAKERAFSKAASYRELREMVDAYLRPS
jgi:AcrR family transcriptional regulator